MNDQTNQNPMQSNLSQHSWGWLLGFGILFIILGTIGMGMAISLTIASMIFFGILLLIGGFSHLVDAFKFKNWKGGLWQGLIALIYFIIGGIVIYDPLLASSIITIFLGVMLVTLGIARILMALVLNDIKGWGWVFLAGLASAILGLLIIMQWPASGLWIIGLFIAIELIITGWTYVIIAFSMRKAA